MKIEKQNIFKDCLTTKFTMLNKVLILFFFSFLLLNNVWAYQDTLGTFQNGEEIRLLQTCSSCSYVTLDTIKLPNSTVLEINENMTQTGSTFYYDFDQTSLNGDYIYNTYSGNYTAPVSFKITTNGNTEPEGILVVVYTLIFIALFIFMILALLNALTHVLALDMDLIDTAVMMLSYFGMWIYYYFASEYLGNIFINQILEIAINIGWITHIFLALIGFAISFIMTHLKFKKKQAVTY